MTALSVDIGVDVNVEILHLSLSDRFRMTALSVGDIGVDVNVEILHLSLSDRFRMTACFRVGSR